MLIPILLVIGGTWVLQDSVASILYYLKRDGENWYFNHALRVLRGLIGVMFIVIGVLMSYE